MTTAWGGVSVLLPVSELARASQPQKNEQAGPAKPHPGSTERGEK